MKHLATLAVLLACSIAGALAQSAGFFPSRPAHAQMHTASGTLTQYGIGNKEGHIVVRDAHGNSIDFFVGYPMHINGKSVRCAFPTNCSDWPATLVVGKSKVAVHYWTRSYQGRPANVTDALTYGR